MINETRTNRLVTAALMTCLIIVATMFFKIPIPFANGYVHLGDAMIFMSVMLLGMRNGAAAAAVGSALGDVLGGFAVWAPWTLVIKGVMALIMGLFILAWSKKETDRKVIKPVAVRAIGMLLAGVWMTFGYYVAEGVIYGNWIIALLGIPWNAGQFITGAVIASALLSALGKTPVRRYFYGGA